MDEIMLKKLGFRIGSLKHIQAPLLHQSQWLLLTDRQKVGLCSKYEGFYHFLDRTEFGNKFKEWKLTLVQGYN